MFGCENTENNFSNKINGSTCVFWRSQFQRTAYPHIPIELSSFLEANYSQVGFKLAYGPGTRQMLMIS